MHVVLGSVCFGFNLHMVNETHEMIRGRVNSTRYHLNRCWSLAVVTWACLLRSNNSVKRACMGFKRETSIRDRMSFGGHHVQCFSTLVSNPGFPLNFQSEGLTGARNMSHACTIRRSSDQSSMHLAVGRNFEAFI